MQERKELLLEEGRAIRERVPRQLHREWNLADRREDPLAILKAVEAGRLSDLLPLRYGRMIRSPFSYMRGAAAVTAADVAVCPLTGIVCQACGDCHPANFGLFASPERRLLFDIIDTRLKTSLRDSFPGTSRNPVFRMTRPRCGGSWLEVHWAIRSEPRLRAIQPACPKTNAYFWPATGWRTLLSRSSGWEA